MDATITRNVNDMPAGERSALEGMLGSPLMSGQQVLIVAYTPGALPDEHVRWAAKERLQQRLAENQSYAQKHAVTSTEADDAIAEAMRVIRHRE